MNGLKKNIVFWSFAAIGFFAPAQTASAQSATGTVNAGATVLAMAGAPNLPGGLIFTITATN